MTNPLLISVVRDMTMYEKCIVKNPYCTSCQLKTLDNRTENLGIPMRYNQAIDSIDYSVPRWLVFCHEDFEPLEDITPILQDLDHNVIYGPIGIRLINKKSWIPGGLWPTQIAGKIEQCNRDGTEIETLDYEVATGTVVDSLDCQCLIVHTSLVNEFKLRFDENLSFDLYTEDFSASARFNHNIATQIVKFKCIHHSKGNFLPRLIKQWAYLNKKYPLTETAAICSNPFGGGRTTLRRFQKKARTCLDKYAPWLVNLIFRLLPN